jgi:hypothetical protein
VTVSLKTTDGVLRKEGRRNVLGTSALESSSGRTLPAERIIQRLFRPCGSYRPNCRELLDLDGLALDADVGAILLLDMRARGMSC